MLDHCNLLTFEENSVQSTAAAQGIYCLVLFEPWPLHSVPEMMSFRQLCTRQAAEILLQVFAWIHGQRCAHWIIFE